MAEGSGKHANTRPGNGTGAPRGGAARLFRAATLRNTLVLSGATPVAWSFDRYGQLFWLVSEAHRIRLAPSAPTNVAASPEVRAFPWTRMPSHARKPAPSRFLTHWKDA